MRISCCGNTIGQRCSDCPLTVPSGPLLPQPYYTAPNMGWQCPKCGRGNAPFVSQCPCGPAFTTWASGGTDPSSPQPGGSEK